MTIANKLTYLAGTKAALRDAINAAGGNIGTADTFRSYAKGWLRDQGATLDLQFWCESFIARRRGNMTPSAVGFNNIVTFTRASTGGVFNEFGQYVQRAVNEWRNDHDPATLTTSTSTASFDSNTATFTLPMGHAFFVGNLFRATAVSGSLWGVVTARSDTSVTVYVRNTTGSGSASSWTCIRPLGLLIEESRTNLLTYSSDFANAAWTKDGTITADSTPSPVSNSCFRLNGTTRRAMTGSTSQRTLSVFAKAGTSGEFRLSQDTGGNEASVFDLHAGTVSNPAFGTITPMGGGWYRCTHTDFSSVDLASVYFSGVNGNVLIDGAQLEAGAFPTSHIPTEASQVTRAADVCGVNTLSPWYNASEGTLFVEWVQPAVKVGQQTVFDLNDGTTSNRIAGLIESNSSIFQSRYASGGSILPNRSAPPAVPGTNCRSALSYSDGAQEFAFNGAIFGTGTTAGTLGLVSAMRVGGGLGGTLNSHIRSLRYFPRRLTDSELQAITA